MAKTTFLQDAKGNNSLSRLIVLFTVFSAVVFCGVILYLSRKDVTVAATAIALTFNSIAIPSLTFLFGQKSTESKTDNQPPQ